ncbi:MAG TPA: Ku protein, partial [Sphingomonadaceae bacterium]|nr:Ku protein [Sphingomonadaceae bacterium]
ASDFHDRYVDALKVLIERKKKGKAIAIETDEAPASRGGNVVDLMAALKRSLDTPAKKAPAKKSPAAKKPPARKRA